MYSIAQLFRKKKNGPRDVLTGKIIGGSWGDKFCDDVADALDCTVTAKLSKLEDKGFNGFTIWSTSDGWQVSLQCQSNGGWRVHQDKCLLTAINKAIG